MDKHLKELVKNIIYDGILESTSIIVVIRDDYGKLVFWNKGAELATGYKFSEVKDQEDMIKLISRDEEHEKQMLDETKRIHNSHIREELIAEIKTKDAKIKYFSTTVIPVLDEKEEYKGMIILAQEITNLIETKNQLAERESKLSFINENSLDAIWQLDNRFNFLYVSKASELILGYKPEEMIHKNLMEFMPPETIGVITERNKKREEALKVGKTADLGPLEAKMLCKNGEVRWVEVNINPVFENNKITAYIGISRDISERKKMEEELNYYATIDEMTGTYNRRTGLSMLDNQIKLSKRNQSPLTICFLDIDGLKMVNDLFGHKVGDDLIISAVQLIKSVIRDSDIMARMGGDEFLIVFPECEITSAEKIWERLKIKLSEFNSTTSKQFKISLSYGFEEFSPLINNPLETMLINADKKMYLSKEAYRSSF